MTIVLDITADIAKAARPRRASLRCVEPFTIADLACWWMTVGKTKMKLPPLKTEVMRDSSRTIITRNNSPDISLQPVDQSLQGLRTWLHLLLRTADTCLSGSFTRRRFRIASVCETQSGRASRARIVRAGVYAESHCHGHQYRSLSADRKTHADHALHSGSAARFPSPGGHRDEVRADLARSRLFGTDGRAGSRQSRAVRHDARQASRPRHGAAGLDTAAPARGHSRFEQCRAFRLA